MKPFPLKAVDSLYDAIDAPHEWAAIFDELASELGATSVGLLASDSCGPRFLACASATGAKAQADYQSHYAALDPTPAAAVKLSPGRVEGTFETHSVGDRLASEFFVDWAIPNGMGTALYASLGRHREEQLWLVAAYPIDMQIPHLEKRRHYFERALPELARFARVAGTVARRDARAVCIEGALEALPMAVMTIDAQLRIGLANRLAETLTVECDGLAIQHGRLVAASLAVENEIAVHLAELASGNGSHSRTTARVALGKTTFAELLPCRTRAKAGSGSGMALLIVRPVTTIGRADVDFVAHVFGLTSAESRVAFEIIQGHGIDTAAAILGISRSTVRVHLQHIFDKCRVHSQTGLTALANKYRCLI